MVPRRVYQAILEEVIQDKRQIGHVLSLQIAQMPQQFTRSSMLLRGLLNGSFSVSQKLLGLLILMTPVHLLIELFLFNHACLIKVPLLV